MESMLKTPFLSPPLPIPPHHTTTRHPKKPLKTLATITPDPWTLSDGNPRIPRPFKRDPRKRLSDDNARRIINAKARYLSTLRRNQGSLAQTPRWVRRTPEQMQRFLEDERDGQLYGKHVVAAIRVVRGLAQMGDGEYDMREVMSGFVTKLTFREMCVVLKEQRGWRQARDFFEWMKLQLSYRPTVVVYTILLRVYGQIGKIKLAEQAFLEMLEAECEPDEVACGTMLCAYAKWGRHKAMLSFYSAVQERGVVPSVSVFNFMISSLQKKSQHGKVIQLWNNMIESKVEPNHFTYTIVTCSYAKEGLIKEAFETFREMKSAKFVPEEVTYSLLISLSVKNNNQDEALKLYEEMRAQRILPSKYTCASLITIYYKNGNYSKALSLFSEMEKNKIMVDEVIHGLLIRIYGKLGLYDDAQKAFEAIEKAGLLNDEKTYIAMAQVYISAGDFGGALKLLELMRSRNILFSRFAYAVLLQCHTKMENVVSAEVTFHALSKTGLPDAASFQEMLNLYVRLGLLDKAKAFIAQMRKDRVQFDEELCKTVMSFYCREGMVREVEELLEEVSGFPLVKGSKFMQTSLMTVIGGSREIVKAVDALEELGQPDTEALKMLIVLYLVDGNSSKTEQGVKFLLQVTGGLSLVSQIICKFIREGDLHKAEILYEQVTKLGHMPEDAAIASMIGLYGKHQLLRDAEKVFAAAVEVGSSTSRGPLYSAVIDAYAKCGKILGGLKIYEEMVRKGCELDAVTISILVNALATFGKHKEAESVIHKSFQDSLELDTVAYNTFIKAMLKAGKLHFATSIFGRMVSLGVAPSVQTYNTMISVYGRLRKLDKAIDMFDKACSLDAPLDEKAYTNMISYYGKAGKIQEAFDLFTKMQEEGIKPGKVSYNIMLNACAIAGLDEDATMLFQAMLRDGCSPDSFTYLALVRAYAASKKYSKAEETIIGMQENGICPSCSHFNPLLFAYTKEGLIVKAEKVYGKIIEAGLKPDITCYQNMLRGYMDYKHVAEGISFFEQISESAKSDRFILSAAVHLYRFTGKELEAGIIIDSMNRLGVSFLKNLQVGLKLKSPEMSEVGKSG
ncbi:hypothetical protein Sjap_004121 [Stephania japonica]|uniref:PROP1-like PPR domain-containing protein n=1 Tax=Stephania japonica TaxID=461633 RepID=A0AAP0PGR7_9MAGN